MNQLGVYSDYQKNMEASAFLLHDTKEYNVLVNPATAERKTAGDETNTQEYLYNAHGIHIQELAWGRVIQKEKVSSMNQMPVSEQDGRNTARIGADALMCAFAEIPTAMELFQKARNMDWRNVEERTFAVENRIFDFTV